MDIVYHGWRWAAIECLEGRHADGGVEGGIMPKLSEVQILKPLARMITDKAAEVSLKATICDFCLSVRLRMISRAVFQNGALNTEKFLPKRAEE